MSENKQPSAEEVLLKNVSQYNSINGVLSTEKERVILAMNEFTDAKTKALEEDIMHLKMQKEDYYNLWNPVDDFVRNLPDLNIGERVSKKALEMVKKTKALQEENDVLREENKRVNYWYEGQIELRKKAQKDKSNLEAIYFKNKEDFNKLKQSNAKLIEALEKAKDILVIQDWDVEFIDELLKEHKK